MSGARSPASKQWLASRALQAWCMGCGVWILSQVTYLEPTARHILYLHFQPVLPPLLLLWLWGSAVQRFTALGIEYDACFPPRDRKYLLHGSDIKKLAELLLSVALAVCVAYCASCRAHLWSLAGIFPMLLYTSLAVVALLPLPVLHWATRQYFATTWTRVMLPLQEVTWSDFLMADMLCSLSKSSADFAQSMCHFGTGRVMQGLVTRGYREAAVCSPTGPLLLLALLLPYLIRFVQCLIVYRCTGNKAQLFNASKYCSSLPALVLSAWEHHAHITGSPFPQRRLWLAVMAGNTAFSFYWDTEQDWDMPWLWAGVRARGRRGSGGQVPVPGSTWRWLLPSLRPDALYHPRAWYSWALLSNLVLRLSWLHRLMGQLENSPSVALALALLEVVRRYQWAFIRVETELRKVAARGGLSGHSPFVTAPLTAPSGVVEGGHAGGPKWVALPSAAGVGAGAAQEAAQASHAGVSHHASHGGSVSLGLLRPLSGLRAEGINSLDMSDAHAPGMKGSGMAMDAV